MSQKQLDARRLLCPMPVIKLQSKVKDLKPGDILNVICTDPGAANDIPAWCRIHGHKVVGVETMPCEIIITIQIMG
jgi:tRNA 2-thiouridine synthesizing protein A